MNPIKVGLWGIGRAGHNMHCSEMDQYPDRFRLSPRATSTNPEFKILWSVTAAPGIPTARRF